MHMCLRSLFSGQALRMLKHCESQFVTGLQEASKTAQLLDKVAELSENAQVQQEVLRQSVRVLVWQICSPSTLTRYTPPMVCRSLAASLPDPCHQVVNVVKFIKIHIDPCNGRHNI